MNWRNPIVAAFVAFLLISTAQAQTPTPQVPPPAGGAPQGSSAIPPKAATSEQLSRSGGVIKPPENVDRKIEAPTPNPGPQSMPVVPPPGSPGGNPDVKPK